MTSLPCWYPLRLTSLTYFPHHSQPLLVVWSTTSNKNGDLMLFQRTLVVFDGPDNALRTKKGSLGIWSRHLYKCKRGCKRQHCHCCFTLHHLIYIYLRNKHLKPLALQKGQSTFCHTVLTSIKWPCMEVSEFCIFFVMIASHKQYLMFSITICLLLVMY